MVARNSFFPHNFNPSNPFSDLCSLWRKKEILKKKVTQPWFNMLAAWCIAWRKEDMKSNLNSSKFKVWPHGHPWNVPSCLQRIQKKTLILVTMIFRQHALWQINIVLYILSRIRLYYKLYPQEKLDRKRESMVLIEKGTWKRRKKGTENSLFLIKVPQGDRWMLTQQTIMRVLSSDLVKHYK